MVEMKMYKGDLRPPVQATLLNPDDTPVNLTGASVKFQLADRESNLVIFTKDASIVGSAVDGVVKYEWASGDTSNKATKFKLRFVVTFSDAKVQTFPRDDSFYLTLIEKEGA